MFWEDLTWYLSVYTTQWKIWNNFKKVSCIYVLIPMTNSFTCSIISQRIMRTVFKTEHMFLSAWKWYERSRNALIKSVQTHRLYGNLIIIGSSISVSKEQEFDWRQLPYLLLPIYWTIHVCSNAFWSFFTTCFQPYCSNHTELSERISYTLLFERRNSYRWQNNQYMVLIKIGESWRLKF